MENRQTEIMSSMMELREEIKAHHNKAQQNAPEFVSLKQSFDRLLLGYQNGTYNEEAVRKGITEIRSALNAESTRTALLPQIKSNRNEVLNRNYKALAERMLEQERGSWDSRHLDIVQGAITHLAQNSSDEAREIAKSLQDRMSDSVWMGNLELADTVSKIQEESRALQQSILDVLHVANTAEQKETLEIPEAERIHVTETEVRKAVEQANVQSMRARMNSDYEALKVSKSYVETLAQKVTEAFRQALHRR